MKMYDLTNQEEFNDFKQEIIEDIKESNPVDGSGFPLTEDDEPIDTDWLWENYGHHLDGSQTGLGYQLFNEIIEYFECKED